MLSTTLIGLGLMTSTAVAAPHRLRTRTPGGDVVVYWGQNGGRVVESNDLATYCTADSGVDIVVLAFLYQYGHGVETPSGVIGPSCSISTAGEASSCDDLASAIAMCQSKGVKVMLSLGGASGSYSLSSQSEAEAIGQNLWDAYGNTSGGRVPRPFGTTFVNGWDFDIEASSGNEYYQYMISTLRANFASDSANTYYITGAPQCPIPEPNMGEIITATQFDYLWVQFYNNAYCSYPNTLNYDDWITYLSGTPSENAKIMMGVPASDDASTGTMSGAAYYQSPDQLASTVASFDTTSHWGGIMMWDAGFSDANVIDGCTYAQHAAAILSTGSACGGSGTTTTTPTATSPTATSSATLTAIMLTAATTSAGISVAQWDQCGGANYTGSTTCAFPYTCMEESVYWSSCQ